MSFTNKKIPFDQFIAYDISNKTISSKEKLEEIINNTKYDYIISSLYKEMTQDSIYNLNTSSDFFSSKVKLTITQKDFEDQINYSVYLGLKFIFLDRFSFKNLIQKQDFLMSTMKSNQNIRIVFNLQLSSDVDLIRSIEVINEMFDSRVIDRIAYCIVVDSDKISSFLSNGISIWSHVIQESICYNIRFLSIDSRLFLKSDDESLCLPEELNEIIKFYIKYEVDLILVDNQVCEGNESLDNHMNLNNNTSQYILLIDNTNTFNQYLSYLKFLYETHTEYSSNDYFLHKYKDILQLPLQPLKDNLTSKTYETFELDSIKYEKYGEAIYYSIKDRLKVNNENNSKDTVNSQSFPIQIAILGAGRGPLIHQTIEAAKINSAFVSITAYEKNENAIVYLKFKYESYIKSGILYVKHEDIRNLYMIKELNFKYDIVISELLGSFGDNELSPECLENVQAILKPNAIVIPQRYSSYLTPINFQLTYVSISTNKEISYETPLVCMPNRFYSCFSIEKCFEFCHFHEDSNENKENQLKIQKKQVKNLRFKRVFLKEPSNSSLLNTYIYGFLGYFDCTLYKNISISTHPYTKTLNMNSWFPIFFPIKSRIPLKTNESISISIERHNNLKSVWYSWVVYTKETDINNSNISSISDDECDKKIIFISKIHNLNGESSKIEL